MHIDGNEDRVLPMNQSHIEVKIDGLAAYMNVTLNFYNPTEKPLECQYVFPLSKEIILSSLVAKIDGREV